MVITIPLDAVPASRPRVTKIGFSYYAEPYKSFKKELHEAFLKSWAGKPLLAGPCNVTVSIIHSRPKSTKLPYPKPDVDNYAKAVLDAMNGAVLEDDWHINVLAVSKSWAEPGEAGRIVVSIKKG